MHPPLELQRRKPEKPDIPRRIAKDPRHQLLGPGPLHRQRRDIGLVDQHIQPPALRHAVHPEQQVAVGNRDPEPVLRQLHRHRIVQHAPGLVHDRHVIALPRQHPAQIPRRQHLHQPPGIGPAQFHLPLTGDIPDLHRLLQVVIILLDRPEHRRQKHVIVNRVGLHPGRLDTLRERRPAQPARRRQKRRTHRAHSSSGMRNRSVTGASSPVFVIIACNCPR